MLKTIMNLSELDKSLRESRINLFSLRETINLGGIAICMNGRKQILSLDIDERLKKLKDVDLITTNIVHAVNELSDRIDKIIHEKFSKPFENLEL